MTQDNSDSGKEEGKAMTIEATGAELLHHQHKKGGSQSGSFGSKGEEWLAALEKASFEINDNRLRTPDSSPAEFTANWVKSAQELDNSQAQLREAGLPSPVVATPQRAVSSPTAITALIRSSASSLLPTVPSAVQAGAGARSPQGLLASSMGSLATGSVKTSTAYQSLLNQAAFLDINLQLTRSGEGTVLWIRDFKEKYSQELVHWVKDLQAVLAEQGRPLMRIMLNGQPVNEISELLGK
jgi:hypothetical protein